MLRSGMLLLYSKLLPVALCSFTRWKSGLSTIEPDTRPMGDKAPRFKVPLDAGDVMEKGRPELGVWFVEIEGDGQVRLDTGDECVRAS